MTFLTHAGEERAGTDPGGFQEHFYHQGPFPAPLWVVCAPWEIFLGRNSGEGTKLKLGELGFILIFVG